MKKFVSKLIVFFSIVLMSFSSYSTVVSNDDGNIFVTKGEFESLKKQFSLQIDQYNASIDGKIDGSIASYLAGLGSAKEKAEVLNSSWKEVSAINGVFTNTYKVPDVDLQYMLGSECKANDNTSSTAQNSWEVVSHFAALKYTETWGTTKNCYRNLVTFSGANPNNMEDIIWDGQAVRYREIWNISRIVQIHKTDQVWKGLDNTTSTGFSMTFKNFSTLKEGGYIENWDNVKLTSWPISYKWVSTGGSVTGEWNINFTSDQVFDNFRTTVELDADPNDKNVTKKYEHIISYLGDDEWRVSNKNFPELINADNSSTITSSSLNSTASFTQQARYQGSGNNGTWRSIMTDITPSREIPDNAIIPSLGMLKDTVKARNIKQDNLKKVIEVDKEKIEKDKPSLSDGFQFAAAKIDEKITWEPVFNYTHVHNGTTTYVDNGHEVDIYFSNGPFTDGVNTTHPIKVSVNDVSTKKDFATTKDRKAKITFEMPDSGMVYVKWVPHDHDGETYINSDWIVTLDLKKCNTYEYVRE